MRARRAQIGLLGVLLATGASACGEDGQAERATNQKAERPAPVRTTPQKAERPARKTPPADSVAPSHCPPDLSNCRSAKGPIVYVEQVDPDGDGDAHFVIADPQGITLPGLTVIDVREGLRPSPLPGPGDPISAAGPVQTGSYGQRQIHALDLHVAEK